ncbi:MAG: hypothetical protein Q4C95_07995 [Planctomycetia bacterium]|nr:hypothetical protein [Planctomycetia bacterium]
MKIVFDPKKKTLPPLRIQLVGNLKHLEFSSVIQSIEELASEQIILKQTDSSSFGNPQINVLKNDIRENDIIFFFQEYPGQYSQQRIDILRKKFPLTSFVLIAGSFCEGERRTGFDISGVIRLYWHQWPSWGKKEFQSFIARKKSRFSFPQTASYEDYLILQQNVSTTPNLSDESACSVSQLTTRSQNSFKMLWIVSDDQAMRQFWIHYAQAKNFQFKSSTTDSLSQYLFNDSSQNVLDDSVIPCRIIIDTIDLNSDHFFQTVQKISNLFPQTKIDLLVFEPHIETVLRFKEFPFCRIVSKPFLFDLDED